MMQCPRKLKVTDLNPHLICVLCGGYYVDATTIIECLHSFCKSCIVRYLETNKYCPICDVQVHKTKPLQNIRPDNTLQNIVYKLVPGLYQNEMRCRREFYAKHPEAKGQALSPEARGDHTDQSCIFLPDEPVSLCLEYVGASDFQVGQGTCGRRYLRCPAAVSVFHLHKLIRAKFGLAMGHRVDVFYKEDLLHENWTLMDVAYIYQWKRKSPIHMTYRILESQRKRIKLSHDSCSSVETSAVDVSCSNVTENNIDMPLVSANAGGSVEPASEPTSCATGMMTTISTSAVPAVTPTSSVEVSGSLVGTVTTVGATLAISDSVSSAGMVKKEPSIEWKEVQLQISENGVMSVAGVDNNRILTSLQPVPSQNNSKDNLVSKVSVENKPNNERPESKVPPVDSDLSSSALRDKNAKCESRTKSDETPPTTNIEVPLSNLSNTVSVSNSDSNKEDSDLKSEKANDNKVEICKQSVKPVSHKLSNDSDKTNAVFKSKTDKLEDTVRNISNRTEPLIKPDINKMRPVYSPKEDKAQVGVDEKFIKSKGSNLEPVEDLLGKFHRPLVLERKHKVYPGVKPVYNAPPKEEHVRTYNLKTEPSVVCTKLTPMEILNAHKKPQNSTVKYKTLKTPIKPWNPSIPRATALSMKHSQSSSIHNKDANSTGSSEGQPNPPPPKQPRFFKLRNMPRFLGNPSSGVKPMYQVAPGSEITSHSANPVSSASPSVTASSCTSSTVATSTCVTTSVFPSVNVVTATSACVTSTVSTSTSTLNSTTSTTTTTVSISSAPLVTTSSVVVSSSSNTVTFAVSLTTASGNLSSYNSPAVRSNALQKTAKQSASSGVTLMKIDPKTLSPIPVTPIVSHVLNNPPRSTSSPQPKKLPPPFTPGSPKHSNHYTNCRTAHSNLTSSKSTIPRIPSPAHTGSLINPFIPSVVHTNPHLLYSAFPFSSTDPSNNRLLTGPPSSELIRAMSALCSSGSAFHSLPPSISMLFNPHHAHHRTLQPDRSGFKCTSNEKQTTQSPPPAVQRIPPSNPGKSMNETDTQQLTLNSCNTTSELSLNPSRLKKDLTSEPSCVASVKQSQINPPPKKPSAENLNQQLHSHLHQQLSHAIHNSKSNNCAPPTISSFVRCEIKDSKSVSPHFSKPKPGEKIEEVTSELLCNKTENSKVSNKFANGSCAAIHNDNKVLEPKPELEKKHNKEVAKESKSKEERLIPNNNNYNKPLIKTDELGVASANNSPIVTEST